MSDPVRRTRWLEVGDTVVRYQWQEGVAPQLVLLHEMGGTLESWDEVVPVLAPHCSVLTYDQRGCGLSLRHAGPLRLSALVQDLSGLLQALGARAPVVLAGCAFGAGVALQYAADHPGHVRGVVAIAPALGVPADKRAAVQSRADAIEREGSAAGIDARLAAPYPPQLRGDLARFQELRARRQCADGAGIAAMLRLLTELELQEHTLPCVACPVLVLAGQHDGDRPPAVVDTTTQALPRRTLETLESGHFMAWQTPQLLAARIAAFMQDIEKVST